MVDVAARLDLRPPAIDADEPETVRTAVGELARAIATTVEAAIEQKKAVSDDLEDAATQRLQLIAELGIEGDLGPALGRQSAQDPA